MSYELINLLPPERRRRNRRDYFFRLGVVVVVLCIVLVISASVLLAPTYAFLFDAMRTKQAHLKTLDAKLATNDEDGIGKRLSALADDAASLATLAKVPTVSALVRKSLTVPRPGITLTSFGYSAAEGKDPATLTISGVAASRNVLRAYQVALASEPGFTSADLPVSSYAKDSDIPFSITVSLAATP